MLEVVQIPVLTDNYQYLLICKQTQDAVAIDAPDASALMSQVKKCGVNLKAIWNTHHHWDHVGANEELYRRFKLPVYCSVYDFENQRIPHASHPLREGDVVTIGKLHFCVLDIPGHTHGHIAYYGHGTVFCGDTLFAGGCGRLFEGTAEQMYHSLQKLAALPDETKVYCMHEYTEKNLTFANTVEPSNPNVQTKLSEVKIARAHNLPTVPTTIAEEKLYNPFLRVDQKCFFNTLTSHGFEVSTDPVVLFAALREWKNSF